MPVSDIIITLRWWSILFLVGAAAFPLTKRIFPNWFDRGYFFTKAVGFAVVSYIVYLLGTLHLMPFTPLAVFAVMAVVFALGVISGILHPDKRIITTNKKRLWFWANIITMEEIVFFGLLLFWTWIKAHEPAIRGLEKFMDYGFIQSILNTRYFPAPDMWWAGGSINYYYFGHLVTALLTLISSIPLSYTFNLMLATLFALTASMSFSIAVQLLRTVSPRLGFTRQLGGGILTSFLVTLGGNMQTIYAFTTGYEGDNVVPYWNIWLPMGTFFRSLTEGTLNYWYANPTRFLPYTIHEFPSYSFVVSDVHGHVLSLPFVLLAIALIIRIFGQGFAALGKKDHETEWGILLFYGFLLGVLLMTNAMDGPIYGLLFAICWFTWVIVPRRKIIASQWFDLLSPLGSVAIFTFIVAMPFLWHFNSFATGIGVNCPPSFLANTKIGPFLFESVENCQRSPLWMMWLLWGFFWFSGVWLFIRKIWNKEGQESPFMRILKVFYLFGIALIIFPEFFYAKDIYPQYFRSNTMFKLGYQAFIMWSIVSGYVLVHVLSVWRTKKQRFLRTICIILFVPQVFLVSIFPFFSVRSYFANLSSYVGIYGLGWLEKEYPDNFAVIQWLKEQQSLSNSRREIKTEVPILVEAAGDSYTDYNQISAFTGFPAITGWAVHEWLWRGTYDIVSPRQEDVRKIYESTDPEEVQSILDSYHVSYIVIGTFEREKYKNLQTTTIEQLASPVFTSGDTTVYRVNQ